MHKMFQKENAGTSAESLENRRFVTMVLEMVKEFLFTCKKKTGGFHEVKCANCTKAKRIIPKVKRGYIWKE